MSWDEEIATEEFKWLSFMASYKYDGYRDYHAGARFIESLATWLQQFSPEDRANAYNFIKHNLIYFSPAEIYRLVEKFFPEFVQKDIISSVAKANGTPSHKIWSSSKNIKDYQIECRKTLFMGLSDGARIDTLRRMNAGTISNEQVVIATQINDEKWTSLLEDLREDLANHFGLESSEEKFSRVYLIDDFTASGTSILPDIDVVKRLKGKLFKFLNSINSEECVFAKNFEIYVHHYIATEHAKNNIDASYSKAKDQLLEISGTDDIRFTYGLVLPEEISIKSGSDHPFSTLCEKYYDEAIEGDGKHGGQSGTTCKRFGYGQCGLPVVIEHNTPNNSLPLLWAETESQSGHSMRPLFRRRERHSDMSSNDTTNINKA
ncbi:phosphoribosyltransferase-like protein [Neptuniibacter pectenicola]|uniref:phosphoribosyltransferase-like protein n=1 Tax=Neptuniibacter pectenicola TaxID=1806669 RepID=UPI00082CC9AB|nr:hypothetical protein [Neptuniibacter pectenicola]